MYSARSRTSFHLVSEISARLLHGTVVRMTRLPPCKNSTSVEGKDNHRLRRINHQWPITRTFPSCPNTVCVGGGRQLREPPRPWSSYVGTRLNGGLVYVTGRIKSLSDSITALCRLAHLLQTAVTAHRLITFICGPWVIHLTL